MNKKIALFNSRTKEFKVFNIEDVANLENTDLLCFECLRIVPNKTFFTKHGCIWCDEKYWKNKKK